MFRNIETYDEENTSLIEITTYEKEYEKKEVTGEEVSTNTEITEPFTILLLGIDSTDDGIGDASSYNGDAIMLLAVDPATLHVTMFSIPRDTYVPISCNNNLESKITHSGWNGEKCVISTIENWMDIKIDYYVKVNFTAVVNLVDEIGGIEIDIPYNFCEQDSNRRWKEYTVYVEKGLQNLNGEQALAYSRNRHPNPICGAKWSNYNSNDLIRGEHQQIVLNAILNKAVKNLSLDKLKNILNIIGKNVDTNMNINTMTSYYNVLKTIALDKDNVLNFERLTLSTYGKSLYDPLLNMYGMSMQIYYKDSFDKIVKEMKINLGLDEPEIIKTLSFSVNNPYKESIIGKGTYYQKDIEVVPNFKGKDLSVAQTWANNNGISLTVEYKSTTDEENNTIISQSINSTYRVDKITSPLKIVVAKNDLIE